MSRVRVVGKVTGKADVLRAMNRKAAEYERAAKSGLEAWAMLVRNHAVLAIQKGPKTGRTYVRGTVTHRASAPGEAPATDTGILAGSIGWNVDASTLTADVFASSAYAVHLELGTSRMEPRPFMVPALEATQAKGLAVFQAALRRAAA